jgi:hypothetical protein
VLISCQHLTPCSLLPRHMACSPLGLLSELRASPPNLMPPLFTCPVSAAPSSLPSPSPVHIPKRPTSTPRPTFTSHRLSKMSWLCGRHRTVAASASPANRLFYLAEGAVDVFRRSLSARTAPHASRCRRSRPCCDSATASPFSSLYDTDPTPTARLPTHPPSCCLFPAVGIL